MVVVTIFYGCGRPTPGEVGDGAPPCITLLPPLPPRFAYPCAQTYPIACVPWLFTVHEGIMGPYTPGPSLYVHLWPEKHPPPLSPSPSPRASTCLHSQTLPFAFRRFNACPAKSSRSGYLAAVFIVCGGLVLCMGLGAGLLRSVMKAQGAPVWGRHHFSLLGNLQMSLMTTGNDILADWTTWCIDIARRRYSSPACYWAFFWVTVGNTCLHLVRLGLIGYEAVGGTAEQSSAWAAMGGPAVLVGLLMCCDIFQAGLLVQLVWNEEIEVVRRARARGLHGWQLFAVGEGLDGGGRRFISGCEGRIAHTVVHGSGGLWMVMA